MEGLPVGLALALAMAMAMASFLLMEVSGENSPVGQFSGRHYGHQMRKMQAMKASLLRRDLVSLPPSSAAAPSPAIISSPVSFCFRDGLCFAVVVFRW